jgi:hypothetical protein
MFCSPCVLEVKERKKKVRGSPIPTKGMPQQPKNLPIRPYLLRVPFGEQSFNM